MIVLAGALAVLVVALAGPVPGRLAGSALALRYPGPALLVWQLIGATTGLAAIGAALAVAASGSAVAGVALAAAVALAGYLLAVTAWVTARTLARRRDHRDVLDLVGTPIATLPGGRLLDSGTPMAYSVPGPRPRVVLTSALLARLDPDAVDAVVAHERTHLAHRHDLVTLPFAAWQAALPFLPAARTARIAVGMLVEMLADDVARAQVGVVPLAAALRAVEADHADVPLRLARLAVRR